MGDKCATLYLDGKLYLQITYNSKSYIPVALARNANALASQSEVNLSVLSNENNTLPLPQSFFYCGTKILVTETCSPSNIYFSMFIRSPLPSLQELQNLK